MLPNHHFKLKLSWSLAESKGNANTYRTTRNHHVLVDGKQVLAVSAAKAFKGDPNLHNPEDLLLASLTSCHLMSYLYCCAKHNIEILSYQDDAEAILEVFNDGSGKITKVLLRPVVEINTAKDKDLALSLHQEANKLCFIANSCNFPVEHYPVVHVVARSTDVL